MRTDVPTSQCRSITFKYDPMQNRVAKYSKPNASTSEKRTYYIRDAQSHVMATYSAWVKNNSGVITWDSMRLSEQHIYGSARVGMALTNVKLHPQVPKNPHLPDTSRYPIFEGWKRYEISNHLGNVLAVITDRKHGKAASGTAIQWFEADLMAAQQYYPFGMLMPGDGPGVSASWKRQYTLNGNDYRYGFNTQEKDDEVYGKGNSYSAEYWQYDPRIGRRWNVDPKPTPFLSNYSTFANNPIMYADPLGDTIILDNEGYITRNDKTDNLVFAFQNNELIQIGELGKEVDINTLYTNLLKNNSKEIDDVWDPEKFKNRVKGGGVWDFKSDERSIFGLANKMALDGKIEQTKFLFEGEFYEAQDIGNHHYGVVGKAYGLFPEGTLLAQAGTVQIKSGTSNPEWQIYDKRKVQFDDGKSMHVKIMLPPYGDNPRDQYFIKKGFEYYKKNSKSLDGD